MLSVLKDLASCATIEGVGCPEGFATMTNQNFSSARCVPQNVEEVEKAEREREVLDPNRCVPGYKLQVSENTDIFRTGGNPIGSCNKID
jgi:hypothetical protein